MQDQPKPNRPLSEISHLFLSSMREKQNGDGPRPTRKPPKAQSDPVELTPRELDQVASEIPSRSLPIPSESRPPITAIIASHLNGSQSQRVAQYISHLCSSGKRIGLIECDVNEFRVSCHELGAAETASVDTKDSLDGRAMAEALEELNCDVGRWVVVLPNLRVPEARGLVREIDDWVLLATCDHDGIVASYRTLKGLCDVHEGSTRAPELSVALLDAGDEMQAMRVFRKLAGVCQQFLNWPLENAIRVEPIEGVTQTTIASHQSNGDKSQMASAPQWQVLADFIERSRQSVEQNKPVDPEIEALRDDSVEATQPSPVPRIVQAAPPVKITEPVFTSPATGNDVGDATEVIDLPAGISTPAAIASASLRDDDSIECPIKPPMCPNASLAVTRERRLILVAVAQQGLSELNAIADGYRWMNENRMLIAMALPQMSIDAHQSPHLRLLVDRSDISASTLQPLLQSSNVTLQTYRKLRWGGKTGLLLEAA